MTRFKMDAHERGLHERLSKDPELRAVYLAELSTRPLPVQFVLLRRFMGWTQERLARELGLKQTHISRLEKPGSDHRAEHYARAAAKFGARLAFIPRGMKIVPDNAEALDGHSLTAEPRRSYSAAKKKRRDPR